MKLSVSLTVAAAAASAVAAANTGASYVQFTDEKCSDDKLDEFGVFQKYDVCTSSKKITAASDGKNNKWELFNTGDCSGDPAQSVSAPDGTCAEYVYGATLSYNRKYFASEGADTSMGKFELFSDVACTKAVAYPAGQDFKFNTCVDDETEGKGAFKIEKVDKYLIYSAYAKDDCSDTATNQLKGVCTESDGAVTKCIPYTAVDGVKAAKVYCKPPAPADDSAASQSVAVAAGVATVGALAAMM